jgi:hypothetical protein
LVPFAPRGQNSGRRTLLRAGAKVTPHVGARDVKPEALSPWNLVAQLALEPELGVWQEFACQPVDSQQFAWKLARPETGRQKDIRTRPQHTRRLQPWPRRKP